MFTKSNLPVTDTKPVIVIALTTALCLLGDSMLYIALPIYWREAGLASLWEVGLLLSANRLIRLPTHPLVGWFYSKIPLRTGLIIAVVLAATTTTGYGLGKGLWAWLVLRCAWGMAWSLLRLGGLFAVVKYANDNNRGHLMGTYNGLYRLGSLFGMLFGGILTGIIGFKNVALIFGVATCFGVPLIFFSIPQEQPIGSVTNKSTKTPVDWMSKGITRIILSGLLVALLIQGLLNSTLSLVVKHNFGSDVGLFGITLGAAALAGLIQAARWTWEPFVAALIGRLSDGPKGRVPLLIFTLLWAALIFSLVPLNLSIYLWLAVITAIMLSATSLTTLVDSLASDIAKSASSISVLTVYQIAVDLGAALGPLLSYLVVALKHGFFYAYAGGSILFLVVAAIWRFPSQPKFTAAD
ncbi:MAG: MFS transporter [Bacillota bacterium]